MKLQDEPLAVARYGVVIFSPAFFGKDWPEAELDALFAREMSSGGKIVLPVWHKVERKDVEVHVPLLVGKVAAKTEDGVDHVADEIARVFRGNRPLPRPVPTANFPVRLTWREDNTFDPSSGYHEGLYFEVFNHSDTPVTIRGFGLDITFRAQAEWHEHELARGNPPHRFPVRLQPNDAIDGYIDAEALSDDLHDRLRSVCQVGGLR